MRLFRKKTGDPNSTANLNVFHKINYIFDRKQKKHFVSLGIMILIGAAFLVHSFRRPDPNPPTA